MIEPLHFKNYEFSRSCHWCGAELLENPQEVRVTLSKKLWLDSPDCCKSVHPVTLAIFDSDPDAASPYSEFGFDEDAIKIDDIVLAERLKRFTPLILTGGRLWRIEDVDPRRTAFTWNPKPTTEVEAREIVATPTFHSCGYAAFFKPSISEVLAQMPDEPSVNAFYIDTDTVKVTRCGGGHIAKTHWVAIEPALTTV